MKILTTLSLAVLLLAITWMAPRVARADFYIVAEYGVFKPNIDPRYIAGIQAVDDATKSVSGIAVGYGDGVWDIEAGYENFGVFGWRAFKPSEGQINARLDAETFYIAGVRYFGNAFAMAGVHRWVMDADISRSIAGPNRQHISGTDGVLGLGYDVDVSDHFGIRLSYKKFMGIGNQSLIGSKTDAGVVGLAVVIQ